VEHQAGWIHGVPNARMLAQYYVDLMMKLGLVRFSMLLALALVVLAIVVPAQ
jgi:hypothetical protein